MNKEEKQKAFAEWWYSVPQGEAKELKQKIIDKCYISRIVFIFWLNGKTEIPNLAIPVIERLAGKKIFKNKEGI